MSTRARLQNANDSKSLWNYTLSPGWSEFDAHILRLAVMRYGCGAWRDINRHFPLKTCGQLNLQTQRLFGQQALAEFNKVHIDPSRIKKMNDKIEGFRKNTCLINTGNNVTAEERERRRQDHIKKFGIPQKLYQKIEVPMVLDPPTKCKTVIDKIEKLREMYRAFYDIQLRIKHLRANNGNNAANIALKAKQQKNKTEKKSKAKNKKKVEETKQDQEDIEMTDNSDNKNDENDTNIDSDVEITKVVENGNNKVNDSDVEIVKVVEAESKPNGGGSSSGFDGMVIDNDMDEETAMALALSASMAQTNINTPAIEKKSKSKKKKKTASKKKSIGKKKKNTSSKKKKKGSRKRKNMDCDGDEAYMPPGPARKRAKKNKK